MNVLPPPSRVAMLLGEAEAHRALHHPYLARQDYVFFELHAELDDEHGELMLEIAAELIEQDPANGEAMPHVEEIHITADHVALDPDFFGPLVDLPLHVAFSLSP